jgi:hypothetical protein
MSLAFHAEVTSVLRSGLFAIAGHDRVPSHVGAGPRDEQCESRLTGHAMPKSPDVSADDSAGGHIEERRIGQWRAGHHLEQRPGGKALQHVPERPRRSGHPGAGFSIRLAGRLTHARFRMMAHHVLDELARGVDRHVLLGLAGRGFARLFAPRSASDRRAPGSAGCRSVTCCGWFSGTQDSRLVCCLPRQLVSWGATEGV